jgi:hypothetical protein
LGVLLQPFSLPTIIALLTVAWQSIKAAHTNPAKNLLTE